MRLVLKVQLELLLRQNNSDCPFCIALPYAKATRYYTTNTNITNDANIVLSHLFRPLTQNYVVSLLCLFIQKCNKPPMS